MVVDAVRMIAADTADGKVRVSAVGQYLKRSDPAFLPQGYGHSGLLKMLRTYDLLTVEQEPGGHWSVFLSPQVEGRPDSASATLSNPG